VNLGSASTLEKVGKYRVRQTLGVGGMGTVYLAEDTTLGREVALKVLHTALGLDRDFRARFKQEARTIAKLNHPHVVRIHAFSEIDGMLLIESEYHSGGSLSDLLEQRRLEPAEVVLIAHQVLQALHYCHESGVLHRDVKPSNILFDQHGRALLADFGLAKLAADHMGAAIQHGGTSSGFFLGTPRYAPPESWEGLPPSVAGDLYSLGMIVYEGISGKYPYDATTHLALLKQLFHQRAAPLRATAPQISPELGHWVDALITQEPRERPQSARHALEALCATEEFKGKSLTNPTVMLPRGRPYVKTVRAATLKVRRVWRSQAAWVSVACLLLALSALLYARMQPAPVVHDSFAVLAPVDLQADVGAQQLLSAEDLPGLAKMPPDSWLPLDVFTHESAQHEAVSWLWSSAPGSANGLILGVDEHGILGLEAEANGDSVVFRGGWADYRGIAGTVFRHGTVSGTGAWSPNWDTLTALLEFTSHQDNSRWTRTVTATHAPEATDTAFLLGAESRPNTLALLYNEVLPRNLAWAAPFEEHLPALLGGRLEVPPVEAPPGGGALFEESDWRGVGGRGRLAAIPHASGAFLQARYSEAGLHFYAHVPAEQFDSLHLELSLLTQYAAPLSRAPRHVLRHEMGGTSRLERMEAGRVTPVSSGFRLDDAHRDAVWRVTGFVSFEALGLREAPGPEMPWRFSAAVSSETFPAPPRVLVQWGHPTLDAPEHGVIMNFDRDGG